MESSIAKVGKPARQRAAKRRFGKPRSENSRMDRFCRGSCRGVDRCWRDAMEGQRRYTEDRDRYVYAGRDTAVSTRAEVVRLNTAIAARSEFAGHDEHPGRARCDHQQRACAKR